jgi:NAD(P)H-dependent flavin oxidoreductase YrpB (nitropropane dioxygenase family)
MAFAGGGALAAAVTRAGGLGLIGDGYGDPAWLDDQFDAAGDQHVGVGFITWSLRKSPSLLTDALKHRPTAVMLSFGDPRPFVDDIRDAGTVMICQCQNMEHVQDAVDVGAEIVVAQGAEAGGHGALRTRVADIARQIPWPRGFTARIRRNAFTDRWHGREDELEANVAIEGPRYRQAFADGDPDNTGVWFGEAAGLIHAIEPAAVIVERMVAEAAIHLTRRGGATLS